MTWLSSLRNVPGPASDPQGLSLWLTPLQSSRLTGVQVARTCNLWASVPDLVVSFAAVDYQGSRGDCTSIVWNWSARGLGGYRRYRSTSEAGQPRVIQMGYIDYLKAWRFATSHKQAQHK